MLSISKSARTKCNWLTNARKLPYKTDLCSVLIIKYPPELVQSELTKAIGLPEDYNKNVDKNNFPTSTDLRIPGQAHASEIGNIEDGLSGIEISEDMQKNRFQQVNEPKQKADFRTEV